VHFPFLKFTQNKKYNKSMKPILAIIVLLGLFGSSFAQTLTIKDKENGHPLAAVSITSYSPRAFTVTNADGQADISAFTSSERIEIRTLGYKILVISYANLQKDSFVVFMEQTSLSLDGVVISATRWQQNTRNIPSKITSLSSKDIALQNPQTAADLLGSTGEVFIQKSQQGGGSPMIRGFATNRLLYTVDGVRMNTAIFRAGNIQNVISIDPLAIESAEVFFGPGSIIYGSDAIGGVMAFKTLSPTFSSNKTPYVKGSALSRYSSANNEMTGHFDVNVGWRKFAMLTSISSSKFGDLRMGKNGPDEYLKPFYIQRMDSVDRIVSNPDPRVQNPTGYSQINLMQKFRYAPNKHWDIEYAFHFSETSNFSRYDRLIEVNNGLPKSAVWEYGPQKWMMNQLSINHNKSTRFYDNFSVRFAQQSFEESRMDRNLSGAQRYRLRTQTEEVLAISVNADFVKSFKKQRIYYGVEAVLNDVTSEGKAVDIRNGNDIPVSDRYPASTWASNSLYVNYQYDLSKKIMLQTGARWSAYSIKSDFERHLSFFPFDISTDKINNSATTGSLGMVYSLNETTKISANGSTGFRAPNVDDIGKIFDFVDGEVVVPNSNLKAEYAYNGEVCVAKIFGKKVKIDLTGYYTYLQNAMVRRGFQVNGQDSIVYNGNNARVNAIQNAAKATVMGINASVEVKLPYNFSITSLYNYQIGEEEMDNGEISRSRHAAPAFGLTRLTYSQKGLVMQFYAMYAAEVSNANLNFEENQKPAIYARDANGNLYSPSWFTLNFKAMYQLSENFVLSTGLENITDQRYRPYSSGLVAPGRNFVLSLKANF